MDMIMPRNNKEKLNDNGQILMRLATQPIL